MADKRKLQNEMDRCFKKIQEGVETFDDIWKKLQSANNTNQKDKYESDLKKEIKKLQRLRDQVKTWAASNEIKDTTQLLKYRRKIEIQMEKFKKIERETKTKAYSKEGLVAAAKIDPAQRKKEETEQWLQSMIANLKVKLEVVEGEIESTNLSVRKKRMDRDKQERVEELGVLANNHKFHMRNLERLLRMLDNETIGSDDINQTRDDLDYYFKACDEPDYEHNEFLYKDLGLDDSVTNNIIGLPTSGSLTENQLASASTSSGVEHDDADTMQISNINGKTCAKLSSEKVAAFPKLVKATHPYAAGATTGSQQQNTATISSNSKTSNIHSTMNSIVTSVESMTIKSDDIVAAANTPTTTSEPVPLHSFPPKSNPLNITIGPIVRNAEHQSSLFDSNASVQQTTVPKVLQPSIKQNVISSPVSLAAPQLNRSSQYDRNTAHLSTLTDAIVMLQQQQQQQQLQQQQFDQSNLLDNPNMLATEYVSNHKLYNDT